jgi:Flp pilus assembly secretin CpaC
LCQFVTRRECSITPTINRDGTITIAMSPKRSFRLVGDELSDAEKVTITQSADTIANVKDGESLMFGSLNQGLLKDAPQRNIGPVIALSSAASGADQRDMLILVTPRIVPLEPAT